MIDWLVHRSLDNRFLVLVLVGLLVAAGLVAMGALPIDAVPDVTNVQVQILANAPALRPVEVEKFLTFPIETAMSGLPDLQEIRSTSKFGLSVVTVVFEDHVNIYFGRQLVAQRLAEARKNIQRRITVEVNVRGRDLAGFVAEAKGVIGREVVIPTGYSVEWGGQFKNLEAATGRLMVAVPLALLLIFVMLQTTFGSVWPALLIYINVPFAVTGGIFALAIRGLSFSISAGVGFIALLGVAVLNGVVLVSTIRHVEVEERCTPRAAAIAGASARLRAVLMTALVASLGFVPMAMSTSAGAEVQRPLATVVIGGLVTSTLLTLLLVPAVYRFFAEQPREESEDAFGMTP